ncbi:hypothetical protein [Pseudomonas sp. CGJS7]|uniref:hypothetical protein n=1 Tax=Pseudomonas sp. CGJS7 TaxID=3109348 RepID=UPI0030097C8B
MDAAWHFDFEKARFTQYLKPDDTLDIAAVERIAKELQVPLAYLFTDSDLLAQMVLAFGLLPEDPQRKTLAQVKRELFVRKGPVGG